MGKPLAVRVVRYDGFGNRVTQLPDTAAPKRFTAEATGPGQVRHTNGDLLEANRVGDELTPPTRHARPIPLTRL